MNGWLPKASALIKFFEGCHKRGHDGYYRPYLCPAGVLTIGYGVVIPQSQAKMVFTREQCGRQFDKLLPKYAAAVKRHLKIETTNEQFAALVSFCYNLGEGNLKNSTLLRLHNRGQFKKAANEFPKWRRAAGKVLSGLVARRAKERELYLSSMPEPSCHTCGQPLH